MDFGCIWDGFYIDFEWILDEFRLSYGRILDAFWKHFIWKLTKCLTEFWIPAAIPAAITAAIPVAFPAAIPASCCYSRAYSFKKYRALAVRFFFMLGSAA